MHRPPLHVVGAAILQGYRCLAAQRSASMPLALHWEFPGGKVRPGESPERALAREIREELGVEITVGPHLGRGTAFQDGLRIELDVFEAEIVSGEIHLVEHRAFGWFRAEEIEDLDWAAADRPLLPALVGILRHRST